jgi:hypothetical protein
MVDLETGAVKWSRSAWQLTHFPPSGRYVLGFQHLCVQEEPDIGDVVGVFEAATGTLVRQVMLPQTTIEEGAWESDDAVVLVGEDRAGGQAILTGWTDRSPEPHPSPRTAASGWARRAEGARLCDDCNLTPPRRVLVANVRRSDGSDARAPDGDDRCG